MAFYRHHAVLYIGLTSTAISIRIAYAWPTQKIQFYFSGVTVQPEREGPKLRLLVTCIGATPSTTVISQILYFRIGKISSDAHPFRNRIMGKDYPLTCVRLLIVVCIDQHDPSFGPIAGSILRHDIDTYSALDRFRARQIDRSKEIVNCRGKPLILN
jgi:hypothetical protein